MDVDVDSAAMTPDSDRHERDLAWLGGFIDEEEWFGVMRRQRTYCHGELNVRYRPGIQVGNTDEATRPVVTTILYMVSQMDLVASRMGRVITHTPSSGSTIRPTLRTPAPRATRGAAATGAGCNDSA
jgi:hypothetical protein